MLYFLGINPYSDWKNAWSMHHCPVLVVQAESVADVQAQWDSKIKAIVTDRFKKEGWEDDMLDPEYVILEDVEAIR